MASLWTTRLRQATKVACLFAALGLGLSITSDVMGQGQQKRYRPPPDYVQFSKPNQEVGRAFLAEFRQKGFRGYLEFQLRVMPRRGTERTVSGRLWSDLLDQGPVNRIELVGGETLDASQPVGVRLLLQGGSEPAVWRWQARSPGEVVKLGVDALFESLGDTDLTAFDLQMPFLWWDDFVFEGVRKVRGRPANAFLFYPPAEYQVRQPNLTGVRVFLDTQFNALVQAEQIGEGGRTLKAMSVLDLKKVGEHWIVKSIDMRDEVTRNKTRFLVTAAAMNQEFSSALFLSDQLSTAVNPPASGLVKVDP